MICETWADADALAKHMAGDVFKAQVARLEELGRMKLEQFEFPAK